MKKEKLTETEQQVQKEIIARFHELMPNSNCLDGIPQGVIEFAMNDVFETSGLSEGNDYNYSDIKISCERTILHYFGHPDYN